jgi:chitin synthase
VAEIISALYGLVMIIVLVGIMLQIAEDGWLAPSSLLFFVVASQMVVAGLLHPQEWTCLLCGVIYYITVPSMYMLLIVFSVFNVHNVTWGTRDSKKQSIVSICYKLFAKLESFENRLSFFFLSLY